MTNRHIPSLDGLRAVSVTAVVIYHSQVSASGGFLAVSQFFTLSGFLVTSILLRRAAAHELEVIPFWGQRYRRLLPASMLTLAAVVVYGFVYASKEQVDALQESIPAALLQIVNWHFIVADVSYVDRFSSPSPIQHFWSLAIEEQFYLLIPLLLLGLSALKSSPRVVLGVVTVGALASTLWMLRLFESGAAINRVYFGTDTRASEMLVGCVLAVGLHHWQPALTDRGRAILGWLGAVAFALTTWAFFAVSLDDAALYRGGFFLYSVLTCVVIYSLVEGTGPIDRILSLRPLPDVGKLTYAIYLFHWPLMLVLTDERTGLDGWTLLALHGAISVALAAVSGRFFETPIRYRRPTPGNHRVAIAMVSAAAIVFVGSAALRYDGTETELAGLGEEATSPPPTTDDGITTVLVIADDVAGPTVDALADTSTLTIASQLDFPCSSVTAAECSEDSWTAAIEEHDPDIVLFHVSDWQPGESVELNEALGSRFDALTSRGAVVAWARIIDGTQNRRNDPFILTMNDLIARRADLRLLERGDDLAAIEDDLMLYARRSASESRRVLLVGDSVSRTVGHGLERWGDAEGTAIFWSAGTGGCGMATEGATPDATGRIVPFPASCLGVPSAWQDQIAEFDPDTVLVISNAVDFRERILDEWDTSLQPGDTDFDDWLVDEYVAAVDTLSAGGAQVVWFNPVCALDIFGALDEPDGESPVDPARLDHVNDSIIPRLVDRRPDVRTFDLRPTLCVDGEPLIEIEGVGTVRPDGVHFNTQGSRWLAELVGSDILEAADHD